METRRQDRRTSLFHFARPTSSVPLLPWPRAKPQSPLPSTRVGRRDRRADAINFPSDHLLGLPAFPPRPHPHEHGYLAHRTIQRSRLFRMRRLLRLPHSFRSCVERPLGQPLHYISPFSELLHPSPKPRISSTRRHSPIARTMHSVRTRDHLSGSVPNRPRIRGCVP